MFIVLYWIRRFTGRDRGNKQPLSRSASGAAGAQPVGSVKSFYSSDPTGSEVEIAIQPGSARFAGGQMMMPQSGARRGQGLAGHGAGRPGDCSSTLRRPAPHCPHSSPVCASPAAEQLTDESYSPRSDASPSPVRRRRPDSPSFRAQ